MLNQGGIQKFNPAEGGISQGQLNHAHGGNDSEYDSTGEVISPNQNRRQSSKN